VGIDTARGRGQPVEDEVVEHHRLAIGSELHVTFDAEIAGYGSAGERCMAISVAVFVGSASDMIPALVSKAKALKVGCGADASVDVGPLIR
jgi:delta 1-pyrroline-5-carboxylate dehydrogenase